MGKCESCPVCETSCPSNECPPCKACESCDARDYILDGDKKIQHVKGTPFFITIIEKDADETYGIEYTLGYIVEYVIKDSACLFSLTAVDNEKSPKKALGVILTTDLRSNQFITYNNKDSYVKLKLLSEALNNIFEEYSSFIIDYIDFNVYDPGKITIAAVTGKSPTDQFDNYEKISMRTDDFMENMEYSLTYKYWSPKISTGNGEKVGDLNIRIVGILGNDRQTEDYNKMIFEPDDTNKESFIPQSSGGCLCLILLIVLGVFLLIFMFTRKPSSNSDEMEYYTEYKDDI